MRLFATDIVIAIYFVCAYSGQTFRAYDYGSQGNWLRYGTKNPPAYNLKLVTAPVVIFWGQNDFIASPKVTMFIIFNIYFPPPPNIISLY